MRKAACVLLSICLLSACAACSSPIAKPGNEEKYVLNVSYGLGGDANQTELSFDATIGGTQSDIKNIDAYEILINEEHLDLLLENGPYTSSDMGDYLQITGTIIFDNIGMTKEDISVIRLFEGIKLIDKDGREFDLYIPKDQETAK